MIAPNLKESIGFSQINLRHRIIAHDALMAWLHAEQNDWIICAQEPYFSQNGVTKLSRAYGSYWSNAKIGKTIRAMIIAPRKLNGYMVMQLSTADCVIARFDSIDVSVGSIYCAFDIEVEISIKNLVKESLIVRRLIGCLDSNAYHMMWGSDLSKNQKWKGRTRGDELVQLFDEADLHVCNEPPYPPTFIRDTKGDSSHIDITICKGNTFNHIHKWRVTDETFGSDHCSIRFTYTIGTQKTVRQYDKLLSIPWKKLGQNMQIVMHEALHSIKTLGKINQKAQIDEIINKHSDRIILVLESVFKKEGKNKGEKKVFWWNDRVARVHKALKIAHRRMRKYKYKNLRDIFNEKRREFRRVVNEVEHQAWATFASDITDPWDKPIKIVKASMSGRIQSRTLWDLQGNYAQNIVDTLHLLSRQFYPPPERLLDHHKAVEDEVERAIIDDSLGLRITICELRKAVKEMSKATAPGLDRITNNVMKILMEQGRLEKDDLKLYNLCLKSSYFPETWKVAKIVLIPKTSTDILILLKLFDLSLSPQSMLNSLNGSYLLVCNSIFHSLIL